MTTVELRDAAVAGALAEVRAIETSDGMTRAGLERVKGVLAKLARRTELFPEAHFPAPGPAETQTLYLLSEDPDRRYALYMYRPKPGKETPAHNHTTWAVVAGISGEEPNRAFERVTGPDGRPALRPVHEITVGPGDAVAYLPDDFHSIHIGGTRAVMHLHLYGRSLLDLPLREHFDVASNAFVRSTMLPEVLRPVA